MTQMPSKRTLPTILFALFTAVTLAGCMTPVDRDSEPVVSTQPQTVEFDLYVKEGVEFSPYEGRNLLAFAFGLSPDGPFTVPGPELRVREGDHVKVRLHDAGVGHTIHWHGYSLPWAMDGVPYVTQTIETGGTATVYLYEFDAKESGTYWYHCHVDAPVHVDLGMFGAFIVEPRDPAADPAFDREATLMLHEMDSQAFLLFDTAFASHQPSAGDVPSNPADAVEGAQNSVRTMTDIAAIVGEAVTGQDMGAAGPRDYYPEYSLRYRPQYDLFMINGKSFPETAPVLVKEGETLRLRTVNAGQLLHTLHLHGHHFLVTHKDGYKLASPYWADSIVIGPGERYDLYVTANNPGHWDLHDHGGAWNVGAYAANDHAFPGGMTTMLVYEDWTMPPLPEPQPAAASASAPSHSEGRPMHRHA